MVWVICGLCIGVWGLGCVLDGGDGGDGSLFPGSAPVEDDRWMEDVEDRREERDDPRSVNYRGDFELTLEGDVLRTVIDGSTLGEATFKYVSQDLAGTPPHCQITLADRVSDAKGAQGYVIMQLLGQGCDVEPGEYEVFGTWQAAREKGGVVLKAVQVNVETDVVSDYYDYRGGGGTLEIVQVERGQLIQGYLVGEMSLLTFNDDAERPQKLSVEGGFGAVVAP